MRQAFAHEAVLVMESDADVRAPGAAVAVALCGHWDHEPPCPLSPHRVSADEDDGSCACGSCLRPSQTQKARSGISSTVAPSGQMKFPDGFTTPWRLRASWPSEVSALETDHAERLIRS